MNMALGGSNRGGRGHRVVLCMPCLYAWNAVQRFGIRRFVASKMQGVATLCCDCSQPKECSMSRSLKFCQSLLGRGCSGMWSRCLRGGQGDRAA